MTFTKGGKTKIAGGFTNSASMNGDTRSTIPHLISQPFNGVA